MSLEFRNGKIPRLRLCSYCKLVLVVIGRMVICIGVKV